MEGVVLEMSRVQVLPCEFITTILTDDSFKVLHREVVRVIPVGSFKSNSKSCVQHLIVSLIDKRRSKVRLVAIGNFSNPKGRY